MNLLNTAIKAVLLLFSLFQLTSNVIAQADTPGCLICQDLNNQNKYYVIKKVELPPSFTYGWIKEQCYTELPEKCNSNHPCDGYTAVNKGEEMPNNLGKCDW